MTPENTLQNFLGEILKRLSLSGFGPLDDVNVIGWALLIGGFAIMLVGLLG